MILLYSGVVVLDIEHGVLFDVDRECAVLQDYLVLDKAFQLVCLKTEELEIVVVVAAVVVVVVVVVVVDLVVFVVAVVVLVKLTSILLGDCDPTL